MTIKFAVECFIDKQGDYIIFDDVCLIGTVPWIDSDVDFQYSELKDQIIDEMKKTNLKDGCWHGFFVGEVVYEDNYNWEYGVTDVDVYPSILDFNFYLIHQLDEKENS